VTASDGPPGVLLGIDGGNTKSIALVAAADGAILGAGRSEGSSDLHRVALDEALAKLDEAARAALTAARERLATAGGTPRVQAAALSLAGADWPEDFALVEGPLRERWGAVTVGNDAIGALRAAIPAGPGVVVVCGTGAATGARGADGRTWHSSFWQLAQGAHELGVDGLHAIVRAELGVGPPTALTERILAALREPTVEAVLHRITGRATKARREQSSIAPVVLDAAEDGDEVALRIVRGHGTQLGQIAAAAAQRVGIEGTPFTLALAGGVLRHDGRTLRDSLTSVVLERSPDVRVIQPTLEPAAGALLLAFDGAGIAVTAAVEERLRATMPSAELFDTHPARSR
jgi:N-acetylglucosamine kinase-like BadF-type ATPase